MQAASYTVVITLSLKAYCFFPLSIHKKDYTKCHDFNDKAQVPEAWSSFNLYKMSGSKYMFCKHITTSLPVE